MREWLLFNTNSAIFHLQNVYHDKNMLHFLWDDDDVCFVLDQHAEIDFYSASWTKTSQRVDMSLHSDTLFWFRVNQSYSLVLHA